MPYRGASGGFHLKTHLGCIIGTTLFYCGVAFLSKNVVIGETIKYLLVIFGWIFGDNVISNILIIGNLVQTLNITKLAYKITKNKYGYEVYGLG